MFKLFKRAGTRPVAPAATSKMNEPSETLMERRQLPRPLPRPEVIEGNGGDADWALWDEAKKEQVKP
jgi:hypothetical protein